ncbi:MAG: glycosyltransferase family 2 protein [Candidatus Marithrix sp.]|nr:glycosyltransferase family 2 protein [Candidatus Marithrix sp.]
MKLLCDSVVILIPAKNEAQTVGKIIAEIKSKLSATVVVIDDASTDDTISVSQFAGAIVLPLPFSLGAWGAIQTGLRYAAIHNFNVAITMDADGQHETDSIPILLNAIVKCDVVIGAYPQRGSLSRKIAWQLFRKLSGINLEDLTSGLRAYNKRSIELLASKSATLLDYQDMGVLILLHTAGLQVVEVPTLMYPRSNGHSRIFNSWWSVGKYMLCTGILCLAHRNYGKKCHIK